ncbi:MAG TPA: tetratricopeptide repeat protein [Gemmatimonadota bacterium]|nr:tetratricopeptide repeat protein [Gemmatimonadota bacterium]
MDGFKRVIEKLQHRSVWQVVGFYLVGSWVALQVMDVLNNALEMPAWFPRFTLSLLAIGLPVVLITALAQKRLTRLEAERREAAAGLDVGSPAVRGTGRLFTWPNAILGGMIAFAAWGVLVTSWLFFGPEPTRLGAAAEARDLRSVAVLPFLNVQTDEESRAFANGIHDDLLTQLSKIDSLKVISRTSVMKYRDTEATIPEIAAELGVATVVEGSIQRAGDQVRVSVQLIDAQTDRHLWAETYESELTPANIFAIQNDIARQVAGSLRATLTPEVQVRLATRPTESLQAYDLYTRGRYLHHRPQSGTQSGLEDAAGLFRQAIEADSGFAPAYAGLADIYLDLWSSGYLPAEQALPEAQAAAEKALELDEALAEAHTSLADVYEARLQFADAERQHKRALELNPGSADAHRRYARLLLDLGRFDELVRELRVAVELDPLSISYRLSLTSGLWFTGDYAGGIAEARKVLELEPDNPGALYSLGFASVLSGDNEAGIAALQRAREVRPDYPFNVTGLAWAYARAGRRAEALGALGQVEAQGQMLKEFAIVYGELGELDRAFEYLERASVEDPGSLTYINADPTTGALKRDPRFAQLLDRLGLQ